MGSYKIDLIASRPHHKNGNRDKKYRFGTASNNYKELMMTRHLAFKYRIFIFPNSFHRFIDIADVL